MSIIKRGGIHCALIGLLLGLNTWSVLSADKPDHKSLATNTVAEQLAELGIVIGPRMSADMNAAILGEWFFKHIDLDYPGLANVRRLVERRQFAEALEAYRDIVIARLARIDLGPLGSGGGYPDKILEYLVPDRNGQGELVFLNIGPPGKVNWFPDPAKTGGKTWCFYLGWMGWVSDLAKSFAGNQGEGPWQRTADVRYLRQWTAYWEDFALNHRRQWQAAYLAGPKRTDLGSYYPLFEGVRAGNFLTALTLCAAAAPEIVKQNISGPQLAIFWAGIVEQPLNDIVAKRFNAASGNQGIQANSDLIKGVVAAADLRAAPDWRDSVRAQILPHLRGRTLLRDGSDTEQSFNYNLAMACLWAQMAKCLDQDPAARDFAQEVYAAAVARYRFLAALQRPSGVKVQELIPGLCKLGDGKVVTNLICPSRAVTDPLVTQIDDHIYRGGPAPAFTSIYFPYGGFAVQRTGWQNDAAHLFFKNSRLSGGHFDLDWLSVQVTAFGRTFLIDSGPGSYGNGDTVKDDYLFSNYAHNTIIVDGLSQNPHPWQEGYLTPIPARWHSSTHFDLAEGVWSGGYGGYQPCARNPPLVADVLHKRQVLLLRDLGIWIITDLLTTSGKSQHQYTQLWNLAPAYSPEQVQINQTAQQIYTTVADEPNIALCHFGAQSVQYQTYYGQLKPSVRGWYRNGNYQPKVDIEAVWSGTGDQVLVTLIIPVSGLQPRVQYTRVIPQTNGTGFSCILTGGTEIVYMAAPIAQVMRIETLAATAQTLLVVSEPGGALYGIALGCHQIKWMGQDNWTRLKRWFWPVPDTRLPTDSEFALQAGQLISTAEIKAPADFHWRETPAGLVPDYSSATNPVSVK